MTASKPLFSVILDTFHRPELLKAAVAALRRQTYSNLEIILINNGATPESRAVLKETAAADPRVKLINFEKNQFSWDDPGMMIHTCLNAGLALATGDYVWYQAYDDVIADDYAEKMVALFQGNPDCTTAAGIAVGIDLDGKVLDEGPRASNYRPRYMPGRYLAQDHLRGGKTMFSAPGTIFTIRRDVLVKAGGYHRSIELSQLYGVVPFGVTGFDETAVFYWRRHGGQLNQQLSARGWLAIDETRSLLRDWELEKRWQVFGPALAKEVGVRVEHQVLLSSGKWFTNNLLALRPVACARIARKVWSSPAFWCHALTHLIDQISKKTSNAANRLRRLLTAPSAEPVQRTSK